MLHLRPVHHLHQLRVSSLPKRAFNAIKPPRTTVSQPPPNNFRPDSIYKHWAFAGVFTFSVYSAASIYLNSKRKSSVDASGVRKPQFSPVPQHGASLTYREGDVWSRIKNLFTKDSNVVMAAIIIPNLIVFAGWRSARLNPFMEKYFVSTIRSRSVLQHVTHMFSHQSLMHLGFNMFALHSFGTSVMNYMAPVGFLAFYLSSGVIASVASRGLQWVTRSYHSSVGASGAIFAVLAYYASIRPEARFQLIFLPGFSFSAESGLKGLFIFDTLGWASSVILRRPIFNLDHGAHLCGLLTGLFYAYYGRDLIKMIDDYWAQKN